MEKPEIYDTQIWKQKKFPYCMIMVRMLDVIDDEKDDHLKFCKVGLSGGPGGYSSMVCNEESGRWFYTADELLEALKKLNYTPCGRGKIIVEDGVMEKQSKCPICNEEISFEMHMSGFGACCEKCGYATRYYQFKNSVLEVLRTHREAIRVAENKKLVKLIKHYEEVVIPAWEKTRRNDFMNGELNAYETVLADLKKELEE